MMNEVEVNTSIEVEENLPPQDDQSFLAHPWRVLKENGKEGAKTISRFVAVLALFALTNIAGLLYALWHMVTTPFSVAKLGGLLLVVLVGIAFFAASLFFAYQDLLQSVFQLVFDRISWLFRSVADFVVELMAKAVNADPDNAIDRLDRTLDVGKFINRNYQRIPQLLRKFIVSVLKRVPLGTMVVDLVEEIAAGKNVAASVKLHQRITDFISENVLGYPNGFWIVILWPFNIIGLYWLVPKVIG